jgi:hypothetical protein
MTLRLVTFRVLSAPPEGEQDVGAEGEFEFERRKFGATPDPLHQLAQWLDQRRSRK